MYKRLSLAEDYSINKVIEVCGRPAAPARLIRPNGTAVYQGSVKRPRVSHPFLLYLANQRRWLRVFSIERLAVSFDE